MAVGALQRLAAAGPAPVYPVIGHDALAAAELLRLRPDIALVSSARHASLLLVCGPLREADRTDLHRLHDQMPHPRATLWWRAEPDPAFADPVIVPPHDDPAGEIAFIHRRLVRGERDSEPGLLPDAPPNPWRGRGDHGQGGEGMMGGKPYGRPMAMTGEDLRDGLALDAYMLTLGPFATILPPGLTLMVTLQGDVVQSIRVMRPPLPQEPGDGPALHLIARQLRLLGLPGHADRALRAALELRHGRAPDLARLRRRVEWSGAMRVIPPGLGTLGTSDVARRLARWWDGATSAEDMPEARLTDLLPGLEWHEAILVINSFDSARLIPMCPVEHEHGHDEGGHGGHA